MAKESVRETYRAGTKKLQRGVGKYLAGPVSAEEAFTHVGTTVKKTGRR